MTDATSHVQLPLLYTQQAQKEVVVNEALSRVDALLNTGVIDRDLKQPPAIINQGDVYIIAPGAAAEWSGHDHHLAYYDRVWRFLVPREGLTLWVMDEDKLLTYNGVSWQDSIPAAPPPVIHIDPPPPPTEFNQLRGVGIGMNYSDINRLSVKTDAVLVDATLHDARLVINKDQTQSIASIVFQTGYQGRAEWGLIGSDDFSLKISNNGLNFNEIVRVSSSNLLTEFTQAVRFGGSVVFQGGVSGISMNTSLSALTDCAVVNQQARQILAYDAGKTKWVNQSLSSLRSELGNQMEVLAGTISVPELIGYPLLLSSPYSFQIKGIIVQSKLGTATISLKINGADIAANIGVSSTLATLNLDQMVQVGDRLAIGVLAMDGCEQLSFQIITLRGI